MLYTPESSRRVPRNERGNVVRLGGDVEKVFTWPLRLGASDGGLRWEDRADIKGRKSDGGKPQWRIDVRYGVRFKGQNEKNSHSPGERETDRETSAGKTAECAVHLVVCHVALATRLHPFIRRAQRP